MFCDFYNKWLNKKIYIELRTYITHPVTYKALPSQFVPFSNQSKLLDLQTITLVSQPTIGTGSQNEETIKSRLTTKI